MRSSSTAWTTEEIVSSSRVQAHKLTPFAKVDGLVITYPPYEDEIPLA